MGVMKSVCSTTRCDFRHSRLLCLHSLLCPPAAHTAPHRTMPLHIVGIVLIVDTTSVLISFCLRMKSTLHRYLRLSFFIILPVLSLLFGFTLGMGLSRFENFLSC